MYDYFEKMHLEYNLFKTKQLSVLGLFYTIMGILYPHLKYKKTAVMDERIEKAINYIELHYNESFSVSKLAQLCNMSVSHFHLCFKKQVGCSAIKYKHRVCVHHAELMLIDNHKSIEEISEATDFNSSIYFREIFKELNGVTPKEYKKVFPEQL